MASVKVLDVAGKAKGEVELDDGVFGIEPNVPVMHQVVTAQLAARRAGTQSTKTRAEVRGGGRKPYKQKGTGNARQGSTRAPHWKGGGVALGPKPRAYGQRTPKKMVRLALHSALSDRAAEGKVLVLDSWGWDAPKTKGAVAALAALGVEGRALIVVQRSEVAVARSFRNLPQAQVLEVGELNAYDVLCNDVVVFTTATLPVAEPIGKTARRAAALGDEATAPAEPAEEARAEKASTQEPVEETAAEETAAEETAAEDVEAPYGPGSHAPLDDDGQPEGFEIKGNADSMLYHVPGSPFYNRTKAEVWFATEEDAEAAGFSKPPSQRADDEADEDEGEQEEES
jgi:large subunit ribosomal protein L4